MGDFTLLQCSNSYKLQIIVAGKQTSAMITEVTLRQLCIQTTLHDMHVIQTERSHVYYTSCQAIVGKAFVDHQRVLSVTETPLKSCL